MFSYTKIEINILTLIIVTLILVIICSLDKSINALNSNNCLYITEWKILMPKIELIIDISKKQTNTNENHIKHIETTNIRDGNVGFEINDSNMKKNILQLEKNDTIIYIINGEKKIYKIEMIRIIEKTNNKYLYETKNDVITIFVNNGNESIICLQGGLV